MERIAELERELKAAKDLESKDMLELAQLVSDMRHAQIESQRTCRWNAREAATRHEDKVDEALKSIFGGQKQLFSRT